MIIAFMKEADGEITDHRLAKYLVENSMNSSHTKIAEEEYSSVCLELRHRHLPVLKEAGLIKQSREGITATDHWVYDERLAVDVTNHDRLPTADTFSLLTNRRNRDILSILAAESGGKSLSCLIEQLTDNEHNPETENREETMQRVRTSLYHHNLPALAENDLIEHCHGDEMVRYAVAMVWTTSGYYRRM